VHPINILIIQHFNRVGPPINFRYLCIMLSYRYILFVDTETSGKPTDWEAPPSDGSKWPHIVQIAWQVHDAAGALVHKKDYFIQARDYSIRKKAEEVHGITEEMANQYGVARKKALKDLYRDLKRYRPLIVGHFVTLDLHMIQAGFTRAGIKDILGDYDAFCTMRATSEYMPLNHRHYPRLGELYQMLFRHRMQDEHNAVGDVKAVAECFFELVRKGEIDDQVIRRQVREHRKDRRKQRKTGCGLPVLLISAVVMIMLWIL